ncbi:MAG: signal peptidase I [Lachnospiraceae bacterium]|nr:signal peptidase I [Lachnospiraceae bacterium]
MKKNRNLTVPPIEELEKELKRERYRQNYGATLRSTIYALITVAAVAVLVATLLLPVLQIYGSSMTPTLVDGDIVVSLKESDFQKQDVIAFYYNNKILVKRVIARAGEWVDIDEDGNVYVNGELLDEPYLKDKALGECDIELPYQVPEGRLFVMGDHRSVSVDSRSTAVGCVSEEQIVGKLVFCIWPLKNIGKIGGNTGAE